VNGELSGLVEIGGMGNEFDVFKEDYEKMNVEQFPGPSVAEG
jgi:hypothetical protein